MFSKTEAQQIYNMGRLFEVFFPVIIDTCIPTSHAHVTIMRSVRYTIIHIVYASQAQTNIQTHN